MAEVGEEEAVATSHNGLAVQQGSKFRANSVRADSGGTIDDSGDDGGVVHPSLFGASTSHGEEGHAMRDLPFSGHVRTIASRGSFLQATELKSSSSSRSSLSTDEHPHELGSRGYGPRGGPTFSERVAEWAFKNAPTQLPRCGSTRLGERKAEAPKDIVLAAIPSTAALPAATTIYEIVHGTPAHLNQASGRLLEILTRTRPVQATTPVIQLVLRDPRAVFLAEQIPSSTTNSSSWDGLSDCLNDSSELPHDIDPIRMATVRTYSILGSDSPPNEVTWDMGTQVPILVSSEGLTDVRREDTPVIGVGGKHVYKSTGYCPWLECRVVIDDSGTTVNSLIGTKTLEVSYRLDKIVTSKDGKITKATFVHRACKRTALHFLRQLDGPNADFMVLRNSPLGK